MCRPIGGKDAVTNFPLSLVAVASLHLAKDQPTATICCPTCGCDHAHLIGSGVEQRGELNLITASEILTVSFPRCPVWRGSAVVTVFAGECRHRWAEVCRFHKGQSFRNVVPVDFLPCGELWRD